ncbi:uncharacterized protein PFLUO_LOCUS770 [Penicillium psychrofluorescens]|uniref:uncharacterized protein n=1 Tax=Penicillium psychrofluorescens TaxID=3158075 RepID=UPI003CCCC42E
MFSRFRKPAQRQASSPTSPPPAKQVTPGAGDGASPEKKWVTGPPLWILFGGICLTSSIITLYVSIIATAIPSITADYGTIADLDWYSVAYLLPLCAMQPVAGKVYTLFELKRSFLTYLATFELGNLVCALAPTSTSFVIGRAIAGMGAAGLFSGSMVMITAAAHPRIRPTLMGLGVAMTAIGGVVGPVIGGAITQNIGWRWCMWIFLPPGGIAALIFMFVRIPEQTVKPRLREILRNLPRYLDLIGFALFAPACVMVLLAFSWGGQRYAWDDAIIIGLLCGGAGVAALFVAWVWYRQDEALIPPSIVSNPVVAFGCCLSFMQGGAFLMMGYYLPLWFQSVKQASPTTSGLMLLPTMVSQIIASSVCGALVSKLRYVPPWAFVGNALSSIGSGFMTAWTPSISESKWIGFQILVGIGRGFVLQMPVIALQGVLPGDQISIGTASTMFAQYFGGTIMLSIAKSVFENELPSELATYAPSVNPEAVINAGSTGIQDVVTPAELSGTLFAYSKSLMLTMWLPTAAAIISFFLSFGLGWHRIAPRKQPGATSESSPGAPGSGPSDRPGYTSTHEDDIAPTEQSSTWRMSWGPPAAPSFTSPCVAHVVDAAGGRRVGARGDDGKPAEEHADS